jgi:general secretion pathway protein A
MYKEFFGLNEPPFSLTPDPRFLYMSQKHREALASLVYGVKERKGFIALTGDIGAGKTTLCRAFLRELNASTTNVALVLNSFLTDVELLQVINQEFGIESKSESKKELVDHLNRFLLAENEKGKTSVLIVDEAQNLSTAVLEQVRMLSNLETERSKLIQIILMGQPELGDKLRLPEMEQLNQRIMVRCHIGPLQKQEIYHYVRHRLSVAGAKVNVSLTPSALNRLAHFSGGVPRMINLVCDRALLAAYVAGRFLIDARMVALAEKELRGLGTVKRRRFLLSDKWMAWTQVTLSAVFLVAALGGCFWLGLHARDLGTPPKERPGSVAAAPTPTPTPAAAPSGSQARAESADETTHTLASISVFPTADVRFSDLAGPTSVTLSQEWVWDSHYIVRTSVPDLAYPACLLSLARLWGFDFDVGKFRADDIQRLNLIEVFRKPEVRLDSFETESNLKDLMVLDLPFLVRIEDPQRRLSSSVVLKQVKGDVALIEDPLLGLVEIGVDPLAGMARRSTVIYLDPLYFAGLVPGEDSEAVAKLRFFLAQQGVWQGEDTGNVYGTAVSEALKRFQEKCGLRGTGVMDGPTAALIAARREVFRPKLQAEPERP